MKIRNGFVSNSSSSSFIIGIKKQEPCPHCGRKEIDIVELVDGCANYDTEVAAYDADNVIRLLKKEKEYVENLDSKDNFYYPDYIEENIKELQRQIDFIEKNKNKYDQIAEIKLSYHDKSINEIFNDMKNAGIIDVIHSEQN